ncbi:MAG: bacteriophage tail assembly protein [Microvirga sp.]|nr:bacteriophage tail assembly protein [Microvirga sp.]
MNCSPTAAALKRNFYALLEPPPELRLSEWAAQNIVLPEGSRARPGGYRNWPYFTEVLDAMSDPAVERITILKSARVGFTKSLMVMMGSIAANDPAPIILLVPTDEDARGIAVDEVEPIFEATPALHGLIKKGRNDGRNTLTRKALAGGASIKILSARAPRKLRRHDCRILLIDEADAMEITTEGDPVSIAEKCTMAQAGRKIVVGSTPTEEGVSVVERLYSESDQRVYEVPCPACGAFHEVQWEDIVCETEHDPTTAKYLCRSCGTFVEERHKPWMVANGRWRATRPEVTNHRGYRINALVSLLANATWPQLMAEWFRAKRGGPAEQQPFVNQVLGRTWKTLINAVDADVLRARVEPFGLPTRARAKVIIPRPVLLITVGADVQDDRIEASILGWPRTGAPYVLGHVTFDGNTLDDEVWSNFDHWLRNAKWRNERGWRMGIDAVAVDSGGREGRTQKIYNWCYARHSRRIYAVKGVWALVSSGACEEGQRRHAACERSRGRR